MQTLVTCWSACARPDTQGRSCEGAEREGRGVCVCRERVGLGSRAGGGWGCRVKTPLRPSWNCKNKCKKSHYCVYSVPKQPQNVLIRSKFPTTFALWAAHDVSSFPQNRAMFSLVVLSGLQLLGARLTFRCMSLAPHPPPPVLSSFQMMCIKSVHVSHWKQYFSLIWCNSCWVRLHERHFSQLEPLICCPFVNSSEITCWIGSLEDAGVPFLP